ncbi:MAG TPA: OmpA family protein, partial [Bacteroidetes bacterium]|nr:OmpA family protein [Bacteroidota bacterium]
MKNFLTKGLVVILCGALLTSCSMSKTGKGALIGAGSGAAIGAGVGALIGKDGTSTAVGAAVGTAVGATAGAIIGKQMDKKAAELEALENAKVETVTDANNLQAIKVTVDSGILFATNSSTLSAESKTALSEFANTMKDLPDTDFTIQGHTDNTGTYEVNERVSLER